MKPPSWFFPKARARPYIRKAADALHAGNAAEAQTNAERALAIYPNAAEAYYALGLAAEANGDREAAIAHYARGLEQKNIMPVMSYFPDRKTLEQRAWDLGNQIDREEREMKQRGAAAYAKLIEARLSAAHQYATQRRPVFLKQLSDELFDLTRGSMPDDMRRYFEELSIKKAKPRISAQMQELLVGQAYKDIVESRFSQWDGRSHPGEELIMLTADWVSATPSSLDALWYDGAANARAYLATGDMAHYDGAFRDAGKLRATARALGATDNRGERLETWLGKLKAKHDAQRARAKP